MLKPITTLALLAGAALTATAQTDPADVRRLEVTVNGVSKDTVCLANYYGNKLYYTDTAFTDAKGRCVFERKSGYKAGVYAVVVPGDKYFELLIDEPEIVMETDTADLMGRLVVKKSDQNRAFSEYIKYLSSQRKAVEALRVKSESANTMKEKEELTARQKEVDAAIRQYQQDLVARMPGTLFASILRMSIAREPLKPLKADGTLDTAAAYFANRALYWEGTDLADPRIVRTPVFHNKLTEYFGKNNIPQIPDTIIKLADDLIGRLGPGEDLYKFVVHNITYMAETSDIMGMDAVFVYMALKYYAPGPDGKPRAPWMSKENLEKMVQRAKKWEPLLIGAGSKNIILPDTSEKVWQSMHHLPQEYVVLVFWESTCGHCKKEIPELHKIWKEKLQAMDVGVYAVCKATDSTMMEHWKKFIVDNKLDWTNVGLTWHVFSEARKEPYKYIPKFTSLESLNYADTYDVYATPKVFILDRERKIVAKSLSPEQIGDLIPRLRESKARKEAKP